MKILGLTGSIAMGKSTVADMFRAEGLPVFGADEAVHDILRNDKDVIGRVAATFPAAVADGKVDRDKLGSTVFGRPDALKKLESIIHPKVAAQRRRFLLRMKARREPLVVLDIPLLFETGGERRCDAVAVVSAPRRIQEQRLMARPGMTREKMAAILDQQMPDQEKRHRADFVIPTGVAKGDTRQAVRRVIKAMKKRPARVWPQPALGPPMGRNIDA